MEQRTPLYLFVFANKENDLEYLKVEKTKVWDSFRHLHDSKELEYRAISDANLEEMYNAITENLDRLTLFHFGGHAGASRLELDDRSINPKGLANLLKCCEKLELVVLNGCKTETQVKHLLNLGIKRVIATENPIDDYAAMEFANRFYRPLSSHAITYKSFQAATSDFTPEEEGKDRDFGGKKKEKPSVWKYFTQEKLPDWKIPDWRIPLYGKITRVPAEEEKLRILIFTFDTVQEFQSLVDETYLPAN